MENAFDFRPRRRLAFPFIVVLYSLLWLVVKETEISAVGQPITNNLPRVLGLTAVAFVTGYCAAIAAAAVIARIEDRIPSWASAMIAPSSTTLTVVTILSLALGAYLAISSLTEFPHWVDTAAGVSGLVLGWPLMLCILGIHVVGNTLPALQIPVIVQEFVVIIGVTLSATWIFLLSSWITTFNPPTLRRLTVR